jgi:RNase H-like domain found in reverse transcriptase
MFYSRKLTPAKVKYTNPDRELLAIADVMMKLPHYLRGTKIVKSDHDNLRYFIAYYDFTT